MTGLFYCVAVALVALIVLAVLYRKWVWANTDALTKWIQVVALGVAAYWAYTRFVIADEPSLEPLCKVGGELSRMVSPLAGACVLSFRIAVENAGSVSFDVREVDVQAWPFALDLPGPGGVSPIDLDKAESSTPIIHGPLKSRFLVSHYPPKGASDESFSWVLSAPTSRGYLFDVQAKDSRGRVIGGASRFNVNICPDTTQTRP
jgi:hypothetical protein